MNKSIQRKIERSLIRILNKDENVVGTGFMLSTGFAITCAHVIDDCGAGPNDSVDIQFYHDSEVGKAKILPEYWRGKESEDIAILSIEPYREKFPEMVEALSLGKAENCEDDNIVIMGFARLPDGYSLMPAPGSVIGIVPNKNKESMVQFDANAFEGMSGSPVFNISTGRVIGVFTEYLKSRGIRWATTSETIKKIYPDAELRLPESLEEYINHLPEFSSSEHATSLGLYENARRLDEVFVRPTGKLLRHAGEISDGDKEPDLKISDFFKLNDEKPAMLIGGPGLGKTSLMKLLASSAWDQYSAWGFRSRYIPIYIPLKEFVALDGGFDQRLVDNLSIQLGKSPPLSDDTLQQWQKKSGVSLLFLFDGLDEIQLSDRRHFYSWINRIAKNNAEHKVIITSRKFDDLRKDFTGETFQFFELQEFNRDQASDLIFKWLFFDSVELLSQLDALKVADIYNTPLLITLAIIIFLEGQELPAHRSRLFEKYLDYVFDETRNIAFFENMSNDQKNIVRDCLAFIALESVFAKKVLSIDDIEDTASDFIERITKKSKIEARQEGRRLVKLLSEHSGICYKQGNYFYYIHSKVEEHLASMALKIMIEGDHESFWQVYLEPNLIDTEKDNVFATTIAISNHPSKYIEDVLLKTKSGEFNIQGLILCTKAISEGAAVNEELYKKVVYGLADELSRPWGDWGFSTENQVDARHIWDVIEALPNDDNFIALQTYILNNRKLSDTARIFSAQILKEHNWLVKFVSSKEIQTLNDVGTVNTAVWGLFSLGKFDEIKCIVVDDEQSIDVRVYAASLLCNKYLQIGDQYYLVENRHLSEENHFARREDQYFDSVCATLEDLILTGSNSSWSSKKAIEVLTYAGQSARLYSIISEKATGPYYVSLTDIRDYLLAGLGILGASEELIKIANNGNFNFSYRLGAANLLEKLGHHAEAANTIFSLVNDEARAEHKRISLVYRLGELQQGHLLYQLAIKYGVWDGNEQERDSLRRSSTYSIATNAINELGEINKTEDELKKIAKNLAIHPIHRFSAAQVIGEKGSPKIAANLFLELMAESFITGEMKLDIVSELNRMLRPELVYEACNLAIEDESLKADEKLTFIEKVLPVERNYELLINLSIEENVTKDTLENIVNILIRDNRIAFLSKLLSAHKDSVSIQKIIFGSILGREDISIDIYKVCSDAEMNDLALFWLGNSLTNNKKEMLAQKIHALLMERSSSLHNQINAAEKLVKTEHEKTARAYIDALFKKGANNNAHKLDFAHAFSLFGDLEKSKELSIAVLKSKNEDVEHRLKALDILHDLGKDGVLLEDFKLAGFSSCSLVEKFRIAHLLGKFGYKKEAKNHLEKILISNPDTLLEVAYVYRNIGMEKDARKVILQIPIDIATKHTQVYLDELGYLFGIRKATKLSLELLENKELSDEDSKLTVAYKILTDFNSPQSLFRLINTHLDSYAYNQLILFVVQFDENILEKHQHEYVAIVKSFLEFASANLSDAEFFSDFFTLYLSSILSSLAKLERYDELIDIIENKDTLTMIRVFAVDAFKESPNKTEACNRLFGPLEDSNNNHIRDSALKAINEISISLESDTKNYVGERLFAFMEKLPPIEDIDIYQEGLDHGSLYTNSIGYLPAFVVAQTEQWVENFVEYLVSLAKNIPLGKPHTNFPKLNPISEFGEMEEIAKSDIGGYGNKSYRSKPEKRAEISITSLGKMKKTKELEEVIRDQECPGANRFFAVETLWNIEENDKAKKICLNLLQDDSLDSLARKTAIKALNYRGYQSPDEFIT